MVRQVSNETEVKQYIVKKVLLNLHKVIIRNLIDGVEVSLPRLGTFNIKQPIQRRIHDLETGATTTKTTKPKLVFKSSAKANEEIRDGYAY